MTCATCSSRTIHVSSSSPGARPTTSRLPGARTMRAPGVSTGCSWSSRRSRARSSRFPWGAALSEPRYGVTSEGFVIKGIDEILADLQGRARLMFGDDVDLTSGSALRKVLDAVAYEA